MMSLWLKIREKFDLFSKKTGFSVKINVSVKNCDFEFFVFLLSYKIGIKL